MKTITITIAMKCAHTKVAILHIHYEELCLNLEIIRVLSCEAASVMDFPACT